MENLRPILGIVIMCLFVGLICYRYLRGERPARHEDHGPGAEQGQSMGDGH